VHGVKDVLLGAIYKFGYEDLAMRLVLIIRGILLIVIVFVISSSTMSCYGNFEERNRLARCTLENIAIWFINEGLSDYYQGKGVKYLEERINGPDSSLAAEISIEKHGYIAHIVPESWWLISPISCFARVKNKYVYEYWVIQRFSGTRSDVTEEIYFLIAKAEDLDQRRMIIHRTTNFVQRWTAPDGTLISFPMDNKSIYRLKPWYFPESFKGTELEGVEVVIQNNEYVKKKINETVARP